MTCRLLRRLRWRSLRLGLLLLLAPAVRSLSSHPGPRVARREASPRPPPPSEAGETLLRALVVDASSTGRGRQNGGKAAAVGGGDGEPPAALRGVPLGPVPAAAAAALRQTWERGASAAGGLFLPTADGGGGGRAVAAAAAGLRFGRCDLTGLGDAEALRRVRSDLEPALAGLFVAVVVSQGRRGGGTRLSRHDLHHGHVFRTRLLRGDALRRCEEEDVASNAEVGVVGALFRCAMYPSPEGNVLRGINLGHCQVGSDCLPTLEDWRFRNALWLAWWRSDHDGEGGDGGNDPTGAGGLTPMKQAVWLLDGLSPLVAALRVDGTPFGPDCPNNVWEGHLGEAVGDVFHLGGKEVWCASRRFDEGCSGS